MQTHKSLFPVKVVSLTARVGLFFETLIDFFFCEQGTEIGFSSSYNFRFSVSGSKETPVKSANDLSPPFPDINGCHESSWNSWKEKKKRI